MSGVQNLKKMTGVAAVLGATCGESIYVGSKPNQEKSEMADIDADLNPSNAQGRSMTAVNGGQGALAQPMTDGASLMEDKIQTTEEEKKTEEEKTKIETVENLFDLVNAKKLRTAEGIKEISEALKKMTKKSAVVEYLEGLKIKVDIEGNNWWGSFKAKLREEIPKAQKAIEEETKKKAQKKKNKKNKGALFNKQDQVDKDILFNKQAELKKKQQAALEEKQARKMIEELARELQFITMDWQAIKAEILRKFEANSKKIDEGLLKAGSELHKHAQFWQNLMLNLLEEKIENARSKGLETTAEERKAYECAQAKRQIHQLNMDIEDIKKKIKDLPEIETNKTEIQVCKRKLEGLQTARQKNELAIQAEASREKESNEREVMRKIAHDYAKNLCKQAAASNQDQ